MVRATDFSGFPRADPVRGSCPPCPGVGARARSPRAKTTCAALDPQVFQHDHIVGADQCGCGLLDPVFTPIRCLRVQLACGSLRGFAPYRSAFLPGHSCRELAGFTVGFAAMWDLIVLAGRQSHGGGHAPGDPDRAIGRFSVDCRLGCGERHVPAARRVQGDPRHSSSRWQCSGEPEPQPANFRNEHPSPPPAAFFDLHVADAEPFIAASFAPRRLAMGTVTEPVTHRLVVIAQGLLLNTGRSGSKPYVIRAGLCELAEPGSRVRRRADSPSHPVIGLLLTRQIPHETRMAGMSEQPGFLIFAGIGAVAVRHGLTGELLVLDIAAHHFQLQPAFNPPADHPAAILRAPDHVVLRRVHTLVSRPILHTADSAASL